MGAGHTCVIVVPLPVCVCCVQVVEMSWLRRSADDKVQKRAEGVGGKPAAIEEWMCLECMYFVH